MSVRKRLPPAPAAARSLLASPARWLFASALSRGAPPLVWTRSRCSCANQPLPLESGEATPAAVAPLPRVHPSRRARESPPPSSRIPYPAATASCAPFPQSLARKQPSAAVGKPSPARRSVPDDADCHRRGCVPRPRTSSMRPCSPRSSARPPSWTSSTPVLRQASTVDAWRYPAGPWRPARGISCSASRCPRVCRVAMIGRRPCPPRRPLHNQQPPCHASTAVRAHAQRGCHLPPHTPHTPSSSSAGRPAAARNHSPADRRSSHWRTQTNAAANRSSRRTQRRVPAPRRMAHRQ
eukprot:2116292-Prymnesium_polylepis.1